MTKLLVQIAPQRSTQYADLASFLAPFELQLSRVGDQLVDVQPIVLGGQSYLACEFNGELDADQIGELGSLAMGSGYFYYHDRLEPFGGPFLRPIETEFTPCFPPDLITARRYKGKTNELFTRFMCNLARFSGRFKQEPWSDLRVFDPLFGGGTTLFVALVLGAEALGIEQNKKSAQGTAVFLKQFLQEKRISFQLKEERLKKQRAHRWLFSFEQNRCTLAQGEIKQTFQLISGTKRPHMLVADLPYGIQHSGGLTDLLNAGLPIWADLLLPGGTLVFSWESTRFSRDQMVDLVESAAGLVVLKEPPYNQLAHRVDRAIKNRDIIVAQLAE